MRATIIDEYTTLVPMLWGTFQRSNVPTFVP